ncbi:MAG: cation-transporting P-type ATPase [Bacteroidales bacterium]|jgi:magnesium-transporting ATPase (P-type)|nr:cation-transporting P-type ATPase [Bacteroidales bacterium]
MNEEKKMYALEVEHVVRSLDTDVVNGLVDGEATRRLHIHGKNLLPEKKKVNEIVKFLKHFNDILIYILLAAAVITFLVQDYVDTAVILLVVLINASIGYFQENKAEKALENIKKMLSLKAQVLRGGKRVEIDAAELTIGDVVFLAPGDKIPADLRLIRTDNLRVEESALTGESVPTEKKTDALPENVELGDRANMAFAGTSVSAGTGVGIVVAIGEHTELGKINQMMSGVQELTTPLLKQTAKFGKMISFVIVGGAVLVFLFGYFFRHYEIGHLGMSVIGLAIAAIPEGLPAILAIILSIGVQNMARRNSIVRTLPSVETLGSVSVICSDKTGTLTKNEMTVKTLETRDGEYFVTGTGYAPEGDIHTNCNNAACNSEFEVCELCPKVEYEKEPVLEELITAFNICNDAVLLQDEDGHWKINGDPTEGALITLFDKAKSKHKALMDENLSELPSSKTLTRIATIPFDSEYKYMATLVEYMETPQADSDHHIIYVKGAPDRLMEMAQFEQTATGTAAFAREHWERQISAIATRGQRTIGAAYKIVPKSVTEIEHSDIATGLVFLGLAGIIDPPREEVIEAVQKCKDAGITVKMITGDHVDTARTIANELGIGNGKTALQGKELEQMTDEDLKTAVMTCDVYARTSPEHKLRIVKALQANGIICAMTGDGVNDAPALKKADIGIAMGIKGTEVTKEAAELVLADDNFSTIVTAVEEGRRVYDNLKKTILFILPTNGAQAFIFVAAIILGINLPLTPVQILWVNMVTSVTISMALAFEKLEPGTMKRPPRSQHVPLLSPYFIWRIIFVSLLIGGATLGLNIYLSYGHSEAFVHTVTLQTIVIAQLFHLFNCRSVSENAFGKDFFSNNAVWVVAALLIVFQASITYLPFMNTAFGTEPLHFMDWKFPLIIGVVVMLLVEIEKAVVRRITKKRNLIF